MPDTFFPNTFLPNPYFPLPALGRRPWFAFLRRARRRRRFALAMGSERNSRALRRQPAVRLRTEGWVSPPMLVATTSSERRNGLRPAPGPFGVVLRCRSIHGFGMKVPLDVVALDGRGFILRSFVLQPRSIVHVPGAVWIAEMARSGRELPEPGTQLAVDRLGAWPAP